MNEETQEKSVSERETVSSEGTAAPSGSKWFGRVAIVALFGAVALWFLGRSNDKMLPKNVKEEGADAGNAMMKPDESTKYADGTYTASGDYSSPAGAEQVTVTLTLKDNVVTEVSSTSSAENPKSQSFQKQFAEGVASAVVGKPIGSIALTVVNGSSLTPKGFMDALEKIKEEAKG